MLLELAKDIFKKVDSMQECCSRIIHNAVSMLECERCSLFMVDQKTKELCACVFDVDADYVASGRKMPEIRLAPNTGKNPLALIFKGQKNIELA